MLNWKKKSHVQKELIFSRHIQNPLPYENERRIYDSIIDRGICVSILERSNINFCFSITGIILSCWFVGAIIGFLPLFGWYNKEGWYNQNHCYFVKVMDYNYLVFLYFSTIVFPALLMACFYGYIYHIVLIKVCISIYIPVTCILQGSKLIYHSIARVGYTLDSRSWLMRPKEKLFL